LEEKKEMTVDRNTFAVFEAQFPDDSIEAPSGDVVIPAGKNIAVAICSRLDEIGVSSSVPIQHSFYGWESAFRVENVTIWFLLQQLDPCLLIVEARASWFTRPRTRRQALEQGLRTLREAMGRESRIKLLRWMTKTEYEQTDS
jgi:hypothetical protein